MTKVVVPIGGRKYSLTCAPGEEAHVNELGRMIDEKLATQPRNSNQHLSLLFAALFLADELHDLRKSAGARSLAPADAAGLSPGAEASPERLDAVARRLEALVGVLGIAA